MTRASDSQRKKASTGAAATKSPRYFDSDGRRWRCSDPAIPAPLREELVRGLMAARRAVKAAKSLDDPEAERAARLRVHDAKVALGERGPVWWEPPTEASLRSRGRAAARALLGQRGAGKTICPSDVARVVAGASWRKWMGCVRAALLAAADQGEFEVRQKGCVVNPHDARGPIRLGLRGGDSESHGRSKARAASVAGSRPRSPARGKKPR